MKNFNDLTGLYPLSKTLRFELKPIGKTLENIERKDLIAKDEKRADEYVKVKEIIDRYHKTFIKMCLDNFKLKLKSDGKDDSLEDYVAIASKNNRTEADEKEFKVVKLNLRKQIVSAFKNGGSYADLFKKELILKHLPEFVTDIEEKQMIGNFSNFTTYFGGLHENRKNMYSVEAKSTAIAYRLVHENLPMFIDNIKSFKKISESGVSEKFDEIEKSFKMNKKVEHIADFFQLDYFTKTLTQEQITFYNNLIGGKSLDGGIKLQGINEYVSLYNQQHKDSRLPLLKPLYKMILSDKSASWRDDQFTTDSEMLSAINQTIELLKEPLVGADAGSLKNLLTHIDNFDTAHIYIANDFGLTYISQKLFGQYDVFTNAQKTKLRESVRKSPREKRNSELFEERINKLFKSTKSFSIDNLNSLVDNDTAIQSYFAQLGASDKDGKKGIDIFTKIETSRTIALDILKGKCSNLNQSEQDIKIIKDLLDSYKELQHFIKPLLGNGDEADKDNEFDAHIRAVWDSLEIITPLYNKVRNWLTRKPYIEKKIKLNFDNNGNLLDGWVDSKTENSDNGTQYGGYIFRKKNSIGEYDFFLGISADKKLLRRNNNLQYIEGMYERLDYYQVKPQTIYGSSYVGNYEFDSSTLKDAVIKFGNNNRIENSILPIADEKISTYLKRVKHSGEVEFFKQILELPEYIVMKEHILQTLSKLYRVDSAIQLSKRNDLSIDELFDAITAIPSKSFGYFPVDDKSIREANERDYSPLYLFKITNKDLSFAETFSKGLRKSRGTDNLHTMYLKALLSMVQGVYDIGKGEVFYRKKTIGLANATTIHKANNAIKNKNFQNTKKESVFNYDIIKNRRYICDKFQFHLSIVINYDKPKDYNVNFEVLDIIRNGGVNHIIGIDRGERHLLYLSLIDLKGNIVKQMTLNDIINEYKGNTYVTKYKDLLAEREGDRTEARRNWQKIENIKELKQGYLSQVVHVIAKMMVEYQAIVVLEDLNMGFMRGRQKIERSVYEQFEKMLIDKLNYYVDKKKDVNEAGGLFHALQLTSKLDSFKKLGKQSGCLLYIPAWNTSKIDPVTGFVNMLNTRYENVDTAHGFFSNFESIRYNSEKNWFEFSFDYNKFTTKAEGTRTTWTLCSQGTRIHTFRNPNKVNQWDNEEIDLTDGFKRVFEDADIDVNGNLQDSICSLTDKKYLEPLMGLMKLMLQMRNSITNSEVDYLISPVADENGEFYDSRTCAETLPKDADANGAYNIARKGLWAIRNIMNVADGERPNLAISNKEWLQFAQQKPYLDD